mmetsp:Transcript_33348/g.95688  ORF Transcript_33348/g.95688 Transcript_33348/m.95688 type:complete len:211 (-) Transcript_33348:928-1560(-)
MLGSCNASSCACGATSGVRRKTSVNGRVSKKGSISDCSISVTSVPLTSTSSSPSMRGVSSRAAGVSGSTSLTYGGTSQRIRKPRGGTLFSSKVTVTKWYWIGGAGGPFKSYKICFALCRSTSRRKPMTPSFAMSSCVSSWQVMFVSKRMHSRISPKCSTKYDLFGKGLMTRNTPEPLMNDRKRGLGPRLANAPSMCLRVTSGLEDISGNK